MQDAFLSGGMAKLWRNESCRAALILIFALHVCFFQALWGNRTLLESAQDVPSIVGQGAWAGNRVNEGFLKVLDPGAGGWLSEPWMKLIAHQYLREGVFPLWNPYQGYGQPLAANMQSQPFYPLTLALILHLTPRTYDWYLIARLFIAGFGTYLYLRLFLSFYPALAGGITSLLGSYYILWITLPHLSVEVLMPIFLLSAEYLLQKRTYKMLIWFAITILLVFLGGMPESGLLLFGFVYLYLAVRIASDGEIRAAWRSHLRRLVGATTAGVCLAAFFLLPFLDFVRRSANSHDPAQAGVRFGMIHDERTISVFTYLLPLLFGPANERVVTHSDTALKGYVGLIAFFLILVALIRAKRRTSARDTTLNAISYFFAASILVLVLKRYGLLVNFLGALPLLQMMNFPKYGGAVICVSASLLCGIGLERLIQNDTTKRERWIALAVTAGVVLFVLAFSKEVVLREIAGGGWLAHMVWMAIAVPVCLLAILAAGLAVWERRTTRRNTYFDIFVDTLLCLELSLNYIYPVYYLFQRLPRQTENPYAGAPFVRFLESKSPDRYRIFARDQVLFPNWSSVFGLYDIRDIDGVYSNRYFPFLHIFFPDWRAGIPELESCFRGTGDYRFESPLERRLLQLSSVKYLASMRPYSAPSRRIEEMFAQNQGHLPTSEQPLITKRDFAIHGVIRETLGEHPPSTRLPYRVTVPQDNPLLAFSYGIDEDVFDKPGDGVGFTVEVNDQGRMRTLFRNYIDPKHNVSERKWMDGVLDLSAFRGKTIDLLFSTDPGPRGDSTYDWAGWSNFHFANERQSALQPFSLVFRNGAQVFEYDDVLPRASVFSAAELVADDQDVLRNLGDLSIDVLHTVILNGTELDSTTKQALRALNTERATLSGTAEITSYGAQSVTIRASMQKTGIVMLNDTADPDWKATIDGQAVRWFTADYLFRGVLVPAGAHTIEFRYRPRSFYLGSVISVLTALAVVAWGVRSRAKSYWATAATSACGTSSV